jgi:4-amino-4-deoxy-L-arabinose transferase-like glycosyltransferase
MDAVYLVVPILAGLAVWMTYALGRSLVGELGGSIAAVFLATSPAFVFQLVNPPMSDIAAAAWWTTALFLVWRPGRAAAFGAGLATAAAILTRPNLAPLAIVPGMVLLIGLLVRDERPLAAQRLLWFGVPSVAGCLAVAYLNLYWYGSPLESGYGPLAGELFQWGYFWPDVINNTRSIFETQGPLCGGGLCGSCFQPSRSSSSFSSQEASRLPIDSRTGGAALVSPSWLPP